MKVIVLGASGMAGHVVSLYLRENGYSVDTLSAHNSLDNNTFLMDVTDAPALKDFLDGHQYDIVINCIGVLVKQSEDRKDLATYLNSYLPHSLEQYFSGTKTKVMRIPSRMENYFMIAQKRLVKL
jgi:dTDP-4-dehydrorhamnose reductase